MRIDRLLVERGVFDSRAKAQAAVMAGRVRANAVVIAKPSEQVAADASLSAEPEHPWVSRGGVKLAAALEHFQLDPRNRVCLDVGASTGGFSDVLLARGARRVYAVDVGRDQLHPKLRQRPQIISIEQTDIRELKNDQWPELPDFVCIDVSFISLKLVLPAALAPRAASGALACTGQAAIRGGTRGSKEGNRSRPRCSRAGLCRHCRFPAIPRVGGIGHDALTHRGRRRQSRVLHRSSS